VVRLQFYADTNFNHFIGEVAAQLGAVPGVVREHERCLMLTPAEYEHDAIDLIEMVKDYGGRVIHQK
jgi:hypothetical protein